MANTKGQWVAREMREELRADSGERTVRLTVIATRTHCNNECDFMVNAPANARSDMRCALFNATLDWDPKKKWNGYRRLLQCRKAER